MTLTASRGPKTGRAKPAGQGRLRLNMQQGKCAGSSICKLKDRQKLTCQNVLKAKHSAVSRLSVDEACPPCEVTRTP